MTLGIKVNYTDEEVRKDNVEVIGKKLKKAVSDNGVNEGKEQVGKIDLSEKVTDKENLVRNVGRRGIFFGRLRKQRWVLMSQKALIQENSSI